MSEIAADTAAPAVRSETAKSAKTGLLVKTSKNAAIALRAAAKIGAKSLPISL